MLLQVFLLGLIPAYASDFLTLVVDASSIPESGEFTCVQSGSTLWTIPLRVAGEVPSYRDAPDCAINDILFNGELAGYNPATRSSYFYGVFMYACAAGRTGSNLRDEICGFHLEGTTKSLHVVYKGAKISDKVVFSKGQALEFGFSDIYGGNPMSYGNFVGVFSSVVTDADSWILAVGSREDSYTVASSSGSPGTNNEVTEDKTLLSYVYPAMPDSQLTSNDPFVLSVGVFGTLGSHHCVHSCVKGAPDGYCVHSNSKTFNKGGSDMLTMALPNDMETYYFEYSVFKLSGTVFGGVYDRVIFKTSVVGLRMIEIFQKRIFFSSDEYGETLVAANLMTCHGTLETCMNGEKKSFKLTFYGYTTAEEVRKLIVHGGDIVVKVEDKDCQEQNSQCIVTAQLFAYRCTQMWIEGFKDTHNGVINPDDDYQAMIFQDVTLVIESAE